MRGQSQSSVCGYLVFLVSLLRNVLVPLLKMWLWFLSSSFVQVSRCFGYHGSVVFPEVSTAAHLALFVSFEAALAT